jgi:hypothetical protein
MLWYKRMFSRRVGPAWAAIVVVLVLTASLTLPPVRALAGQFLDLFRVQKIEVVEFSPAALFDGGDPEVAIQSLEKVMDEQVNVTLSGDPQTVDEATLRSLSSIRVRLPQGVSGDPHYVIEPGADVVVNVDLPRIRTLLTELGYTDVELPDELDGSQVSVALAPSVVAAYGTCQPNTEEWAVAHGPDSFEGDCTVLAQMVSPVVSAPPELDVDVLGQAYLQLLGLSSEEAGRFGKQVDWAATLVMPLPRSEVTHEEFTVDGVTGVLIRPAVNRLPTDEYSVMWVNDDIVYVLTGVGTDAEARQIANSLQ